MVPQASARIDFLELNKAFGGQPNWMIEHLFQGVRPVKVTMKIQTRNGQARVDVDRVEDSRRGGGWDGAAVSYRSFRDPGVSGREGGEVVPDVASHGPCRSAAGGGDGGDSQMIFVFGFCLGRLLRHLHPLHGGR